MVAVLLGCGLRRAELVELTMESLQMREDHWITADLIGKGQRVRTVPMPEWTKTVVDDWTRPAEITNGKIFRRINRHGGVWGEGMSAKVVWQVVKQAARQSNINQLAPHDLRSYAERLIMPSGVKRAASSKVRIHIPSA